MSAHPNPPVPAYDRTKDGNPFAWIVKTAPIVRAERAACALVRRANEATVRAFEALPVKP